MIAVFSGTGNSMFVAKRLSELLGDQLVDISLFMRPEGKDTRFPTPDNGRILWVFPVYSWGVPPVVADFIANANIPGAEKLRHSLIVTCGDDTGTVDRQWRRLLERRGWKGGDAWSVQLPNIYVLMKGFDVDSPELAEKKIVASEPRIAHIAKQIELRALQPAGPVVNDLVRGAFATLKSGIVYPWFKRFAMSPKFFFSTDACIGCGKCVRSCPLANITLGDRSCTWGDHCALCLRCYHVCPRHAVAYSTATRNKGQKKQLLNFVEFH